jgi:hypothetical protein
MREGIENDGQQPPHIAVGEFKPRKPANGVISLPNR